MLASARRGISYPNPDRSDAPDVPAHILNLVNALELDVIFAQGTDAARIAAAHQTNGGKIWWTTDTLQYWYDDGTTWRLIGASISRGTFALRPTVGPGNANSLYFATDVGLGTLYYSDGSAWTKIAEMLGDNSIPPSRLQAQSLQSKGANYTPVVADRLNLIQASAALTITLPSDSTAAFGVGDSIDFMQIGAGQITFAAGAGASVNSYGGLLKSAGQWAMVSALKIAANTWVLVGNLSA